MNQISKFLVCILSLILSGVVCRAQDFEVTGTIIDKTYGEPVIGAAVIVTGTDLGTITDIDGVFHITVPQGAILQISSIGMKTISLPAEREMSIVLEDDILFLEEVVVTGYMAEKDNRVYYQGVQFTAGKDEYLPITNNQYKFSGRNYVQNPGYGQF